MLQTEHFNISVTSNSFRNNSIHTSSNMLQSEHESQKNN